MTISLNHKELEIHAILKKRGGGAPENKLLNENFLGFTLELLRFKKRFLPCYPEGKVRRISKKNRHEILHFVQNDIKCAFTLAEVLITLGIIGIIAAMTLPALIGAYQKKVLEEQFKVAYSMLSQLLIKSESDIGAKANCFYWDKSPYPSLVCIEYDESGSCIKKGLPDGSPVPSDYTGPRTECRVLLNSILSNVQVITTCEGKAYEKGCIPEYEGNDTVRQANTPDLSDEQAYTDSAGCAYFRKNEILNNRYAYVFKNGMILIPYDFSTPIYAIDINGKKGPNKWGYDLFTFMVRSNNHKPLELYGDGCFVAEKGGVTAQKMIERIYAERNK